MFAAFSAYLSSIKARDPAPRTRWEILLYPGLWAVGLHRVAHGLFGARLFFLARLVNHISRALTAIDIHPGATIGRHLFIDHGFVVIGETAVIGDNVTIYQGATLGGTNPTNGQGGKRHPTIEDGVIISLGAAVLGPIVVGAGARIGANAVVTRDVVPGATMVGIPARSTLVEVKPETRDFVPYGTPCSDMFDPQTQKLELMACQLLDMQKRVATLMEERDAKAAGKAAGQSHSSAKGADIAGGGDDAGAADGAGATPQRDRA
ncbi:MAG: serine O-acetyltransferase EpsC [Sphingopyxis sp.]